MLQDYFNKHFLYDARDIYAFFFVNCIRMPHPEENCVWKAAIDPDRSRNIANSSHRLATVAKNYKKIAKDYQKLPMFVIFVKSCQKLPKGAKSFKKLRLCYHVSQFGRFIYWYRIYFWQQLGNMRQLEGVYAPFGRGLGECAFSRIYICAIFRSKICLFAIFTCFSISVRGLNLPVPNLPWANLRGANMLGKRQIGH